MSRLEGPTVQSQSYVNILGRHTHTNNFLGPFNNKICTGVFAVSPKKCSVSTSENKAKAGREGPQKNLVNEIDIF